jgi:predicted O-methyltransferase YrrM
VDTSAGAFETAWARVDVVEGWLTRDQARVLHSETARLANGASVVEIGSHLGRSTLLIASSLPDEGLLTVVDPFLTSWRYAVADAEAQLRALLDMHRLTHRVRVRPVTSAQARSEWSGAIDLLYVDGGHGYRTVVDDLEWARFVPEGGHILVHDAFSSVGVTAALLPRLTVGSGLRYTSRTGSLAVLEAGRPTVRDRLRPWREIPWFARNLLVKILLRLHAVRLAGLVGHSGAADPF